MMKSILASNRR
jgi:hypothetical protein